MKYFHSLDRKIQLQIAINRDVDLVKLYLQPPWCGYPYALSKIGCSFLLNAHATKEFCEDCEKRR